jgi:NADH-quinone oxidoreductase subunit M
MFASASHSFAPFIFVLSVMAIIYTSFVALAQEDMKKLIAYSSVAHMGFVTMGIFSMTHQGIEGGIYQMLSHGVVSGALFLCVGVIYDRMHTREIAAYGGLASRMPVYAACLMVFTLANVGLPGTGGFVGEFLTMLGTFRVNTWVVIFAASGAILSAAYMLYLYWRVIFGKLVKPALQTIQDLSLREFAILSPLVIITIIMGVYPNFVFDVTHASVANLVHQSQLAMAYDERFAANGSSPAQRGRGTAHGAVEEAFASTPLRAFGRTPPVNGGRAFAAVAGGSSR